MALRLCAGCSRHVKTADTSCPFCGATSNAAVASPRSRATRAAMVFGSAVMVSGAVACSSASDSAVPLYGAPSPTSSATDNPTAVPLYGAPAPDAGPNDTDGSVAPLYGAPADASVQDSGDEDGGKGDASKSDASPAPLYGLPPDPI